MVMKGFCLFVVICLCFSQVKQEQKEMFSTLFVEKQGSKKGNLNHLLNFRFDSDADDNVRSLNPRGFRGKSNFSPCNGMMFNKEQFIKAKYVEMFELATKLKFGFIKILLLSFGLFLLSTSFRIPSRTYLHIKSVISVEFISSFIALSVSPQIWTGLKILFGVVQIF